MKFFLVRCTHCQFCSVNWQYSSSYNPRIQTAGPVGSFWCHLWLCHSHQRPCLPFAHHIDSSEGSDLFPASPLCFLRGLCKLYYCVLGLHISWVLATSLTARGSDSSRVCSQMAAWVCFFTSVHTERDAQEFKSQGLRCTSSPARSVRGAGDGPLHFVIATFLVFDT